MARYEIIGGKPLGGTVTISGAKNAAVAILPAAFFAPLMVTVPLSGFPPIISYLAKDDPLLVKH